LTETFLSDILNLLDILSEALESILRGELC